MRSFIATLLLLLLTLAATACNFSYINSTADTLQAQAEALPPPQSDESVAEIDRLEELWEKNVPLVSLTVDFLTVDRVTEQITLLKVCAVQQDLDGYFSALALLWDAVEDMRRLESFSPQNLL